MTGVLDIAMRSFLSDLNCVKIYDIFDPTYSRYYGFN
jgi:hypothetical protein